MFHIIIISQRKCVAAQKIDLTDGDWTSNFSAHSGSDVIGIANI